MGKIIIDQNFLGTEKFVEVCFKTADSICQERGKTPQQIQFIADELNKATDPQEFKKIYDKYFNEEVILRLYESQNG